VSEWRERKLEDLGLLQRGRSRHRPRYDFHLFGGKYPFIQTGEVREARKYIRKFEQTYSDAGLAQSKLWPKNTLCITIAANIAELAILSFEACFPDSVLGFIPNENTDLDFVYYTLTHFQKELKHIGEGSVQDNINLGTFQDVLFPIPGLEEQKAIALVLSSLDDKIDLLHRQNTTLERMAETLFRQWFVEEAQSFKLGKIGDLIEGTFGGDWGKETPEGDFINAANCIRGTDIADLQTGLAKKIPLRFISTKKLQNIEPKNGDIIFEISGGTETQSTGRATYINDDVRSLFAHPLVFSNFCRLLRPLNSTYSFFIYLYLNYLYGQDEFFGLENGSSGIKNLNYKALIFELDYPMPSLDRVQEFNLLIAPNFSKINQNKKQIQALEKLRDNLLPKLMSGEVRVKLN